MKLTKAEVQYQDYPKGTKECAGCTMFRKPHGCTLVLGKINSYGYCIRHEAKR